MLKDGFQRFLTAEPDRLHAAAHSHHPWPDISYDAHRRAWEDAARMVDDKWDHVLKTVIPSARAKVADVLGLPDPATLVFAPNTHEFVLRIASTLPRPFTVLTTDSEFHSFARQLERWEEAGVATATRVAAEPFDSFPDRLASAFADHHLVFFSHVHFNSGYVVPGLAELIGAFPSPATVVVDGYHGFMAVPTDLGPIADRAFYLAGGYKYAMAGEGAAFLHVPPSAPSRPVDTGWFAAFGALAQQVSGVPYAAGGQRFAGATFDPSGIYRLDATLGWLASEGVTVKAIHRHVGGLQERLLSRLDPALVGRLVPGPGAADRGHFVTFRLDDAASMYEALRQRNVITDYRADRWRAGLGIYHDDVDVDRLAEAVNEAR